MWIPYTPQIPSLEILVLFLPGLFCCLPKSGVQSELTEKSQRKRPGRSDGCRLPQMLSESNVQFQFLKVKTFFFSCTQTLSLYNNVGGTRLGKKVKKYVHRTIQIALL